jgi:hypothetical protein
MATALEDKINSIERALTRHTTKGNIRSWKRVPGVSRRWNATLQTGDDVNLQTLREAHIFACALASADQAATARQASAEHTEIPAHLDGKYRLYIRPVAGCRPVRDVGTSQQDTAERLARALSNDTAAGADGQIPFYVAVYDGNAYPVAMYRGGQALTGASYEMALFTPYSTQAV